MTQSGRSVAFPSTAVTPYDGLVAKGVREAAVASKQTGSFGSWSSPITADAVVAGALSLVGAACRRRKYLLDRGKTAREGS
jgi:hypothetical protein